MGSEDPIHHSGYVGGRGRDKKKVLRLKVRDIFLGLRKRVSGRERGVEGNVLNEGRKTTTQETKKQR